ncbi:MAG: hypothetical protein KGH89_02345 [Thaumarchaeota archaeon]|nr:hypothetical protein [Nitrososphaerota archaeon]MDE1867821.1 hypothetical protein [Nitrososphaerota archaeon]
MTLKGKQNCYNIKFLYLEVSQSQPKEEEKEMMQDPTLRQCALDGCDVYFDICHRGRVRKYCCNKHKVKDDRIQRNKKIQEYDFLRLQKQKLVALLTPQQRKKAHDWGLLD